MKNSAMAKSANESLTTEDQRSSEEVVPSKMSEIDKLEDISKEMNAHGKILTTMSPVSKSSSPSGTAAQHTLETSDILAECFLSSF